MVTPSRKYFDNLYKFFVYFSIPIGISGGIIILVGEYLLNLILIIFGIFILFILVIIAEILINLIYKH
jgi:hypothetical protein